jgi:plastocyanin
MTAFGVVVVASLLMSGQEARADADCKVVKQTPGGVTVGKNVDVYAICNGVDYQSTEFLWKIIPIDPMGNRGAEINLGGGLRTSRLQNVHYDRPGTYEIVLSYGANGTWHTASLPMTAAPPNPPAVAPKPPTAAPPVKVAFLDQVAFSPASFTIKPGERATVTATKPTAGDPHIRWSLPGATGNAQDRWTMTFTMHTPGDYTLEAVVYDGNNTATNRSWALPVHVTAGTLNVGLQGKQNLQLNERALVVVTARDGVAPYHLAVSVAGGNSGSAKFDRQTTFLVPTQTPGTKTITIAVNDAKGSTFSRTVNFSVGGTAPLPAAPVGSNPYVGSYEATVTGTASPDPGKYWAHVVNLSSDGTLDLRGRFTPLPTVRVG